MLQLRKQVKPLIKKAVNHSIFKYTSLTSRNSTEVSVSVVMYAANPFSQSNKIDGKARSVNDGMDYEFVLPGVPD